MRTEQEIIGDIMQMVKEDRFGNIISGSVYRDGMRPRNSANEDITVIFTTGDGNDQIQYGVVTILCYVPDIMPFGNGVYCKDGARLEELQYAAKTFVESLTCKVSNYRFTLKESIQSLPLQDINQHAISVQMSFQYVSSEDDTLPVLIAEDGDVIVTGCAYLSDNARIELIV